MKPTIILRTLGFAVLFLVLNAVAKAQTAAEVFKQGNDAYGANHYEQAIENYKKAIALNYQPAESYYWLGSSYYGLQRYKEAITALNNAAKLNPDHYDTWVYLGNSLDYD